MNNLRKYVESYMETEEEKEKREKKQREIKKELEKKEVEERENRKQYSLREFKEKKILKEKQEKIKNANNKLKSEIGQYNSLKSYFRATGKEKPTKNNW
ncbi:MAG: hypothetical protein PWP46_1359 [Fusobacteriaceae bacterium]|nr:hypothetical protein [Fusobacteriaceae bacterium]